MRSKGGRPVTRFPYGNLLCRYREHFVPHGQFGKTSVGTIDSWCRECRREYARYYNAIKAKRKRELSTLSTVSNGILMPVESK